jgi:acetoin utilization deacetylase AcuC-like enzyme
MRAQLPPTDYVDALRRGVEASLEGFTPDLVMISAGFDSLAGDPLGAFTLEYEHFEELTKWLVGIAEQHCGGRVVSALEGGYAPERLGVACVRHMRALL